MCICLTARMPQELYQEAMIPFVLQGPKVTAQLPWTRALGPSMAMESRISRFFVPSSTPVSSFTIERVDKKTSVVKQVRDSTVGTPVFFVHTSSSKPHLTIKSPFQHQDVVATVTYHSLSSKIEVSLYDRHIQLKRRGLLSDAHSFDDATVSKLRWEESSGLFLPESFSWTCMMGAMQLQEAVRVRRVCSC